MPSQPLTHVGSVLSHVFIYGFHFLSISFFLSSLCIVLLSFAMFLFSLLSCVQQSITTVSHASIATSTSDNIYLKEEASHLHFGVECMTLEDN